MKNPNLLCPGCMNEWGHPEKPCPVCGFVEKTYEKPPRWLPLKTVLNGKYMIGKVIGEGGFGITYVAWDLNLQVRVAIKEYFPVELATRETGGVRQNSISALPGVRQENYRQGLEKFMTEAKNLSKFYNLKGIVAVRDFFFENDTAYMVMEFVDGITLGTYLKKHGGQITEQEALALFHPVMESLKVVHQSGIIHRDISPDNIMMTKDGRMKLIDFGAARFAGGDKERSLTIILKHGYAPAEQYQSHGNQGPWTDVYAICATMYRMITGKVPPSAMDRLHEDTLEEFSALGCRVSEKTAYAVIDKGLAIRVEDRYRNMDELIDGLYGMDVKKVRRKKKTEKKLLADWRLWAAGGVAVLALCLGAAGVIALNGGKSPEEAAGSQAVIAGDTGEKAQASGGEGKAADSGQDSQSGAQDDRPWPSASEAELVSLFEEANEAEKALSAAGNHLIALQEDGTAGGSGQSPNGELELGSWTGIIQVSAGIAHTLGLKEDGTAIAAGSTEEGKCAVELWKGLTAVSAGDAHSLGLKADGTVYAAGSNSAGQCSVSSWTGITRIAAGAAHSLGLKEDGTVVSAGDSQDSACRTEGWTDIAVIYAKGHVSAGIKKDGTVVIAGDEGLAKEVEGWKSVVSLTLGDGFIAGLLSDKTVRVAGKSASGSLSVSGWEDIAVIAASDETLFGKKSDGSIVRTFYEYGSVKKEEFTGLTKAVSCGGYLLGLTEDQKVLSWGASGSDPGAAAVSGWSDIADIAGNQEAIFGLKTDGTVELICSAGSADGFGTEGSAGSANGSGAAECAGEANGPGAAESAGEANGPGAAESEGVSDGFGVLDSDGAADAEGSGYEAVREWTGIRDIAAAQGLAAGLCEDGTVVITGPGADEAVQKTVRGWSNVAALAEGNGGCLAAICEDGTVFTLPEYGWDISGETAAVSAAIGGGFAVTAFSDGTVKSYGSAPGGSGNVYSWRGIIQTAVGASHAVGLKSDGTVVAAGSNANGQCDVGNWTDVVYIAAGEYYTVGVLKDGTMVVAGKLPGEY